MSDRKNNFEFPRHTWPKQPSAERVVGERGRKELPPGTKGGENMKPDRHAEHKQHAFDSFCKKVLKCEACNGYREISRRKKHSIPFSELPEDAMEQFASLIYFVTCLPVIPASEPTISLLHLSDFGNSVPEVESLASKCERYPLLFIASIFILKLNALSLGSISSL